MYGRLPTPSGSDNRQLAGVRATGHDQPSKGDVGARFECMSMVLESRPKHVSVCAHVCASEELCARLFSPKWQAINDLRGVVCRCSRRAGLRDRIRREFAWRKEPSQALRREPEPRLDCRDEGFRAPAIERLARGCAQTGPTINALPASRHRAFDCAALVREMERIFVSLRTSNPARHELGREFLSL